MSRHPSKEGCGRTCLPCSCSRLQLPLWMADLCSSGVNFGMRPCAPEQELSKGFVDAAGRHPTDPLHDETQTSRPLLAVCLGPSSVHLRTHTALSLSIAALFGAGLPACVGLMAPAIALTAAAGRQDATSSIRPCARAQGHSGLVHPTTPCAVFASVAALFQQDV